MRASTNVTGKGSEVRENLPSLKNCGGCGFEFFSLVKTNIVFQKVYVGADDRKQPTDLFQIG